MMSDYSDVSGAMIFLPPRQNTIRACRDKYNDPRKYFRNEKEESRDMGF